MSNKPEQSGNKENESRSTNLWHRWVGDPDVPFHRYCSFLPGIESRQVPDDKEIQLTYIDGLPRALLQFTPLVVMTSIVLFVVSTELRTDMVGVGDYVPVGELPELLPILIVGVGWLIVLLYLFKTAGILDRNFGKSIIVYGLGTVLVAGVIGAILKVSLGSGGEHVTSSDIESFGNFSDILRTSGFWLTFLIGGYLTYDLILRIENLFSRLPQKYPEIIEPINGSAPEKTDEKYEQEFLDDFSGSLDSSINLERYGRSYSIPTSYIFAFMFTLPFFISGPVLSAGSFSTGLVKILTSPTLFVIAFVPTVLVFVNIVVFFQFLVLVYYFRRLLVKHSPDNDAAPGFWLKYHPHHPDGNAGFRDMGQFATRVNGLLILGGFYLAYRFYVGGAYHKLPETINSPEMIRWVVEFGGPFLTYIIGIIVWMYFSFWQLHKTMRRGRERRIKEVLAESNDGELPEGKEDFKSAPLWPVNTSVFFSLFVGDLLPLLTLFPVI